MRVFAATRTALAKPIAVAKQVFRDFSNGLGVYAERCLYLSVGLPCNQAVAYFGFEAVLSDLADFAAQFLDIEAFFAQFGQSMAEFALKVSQFNAVNCIFFHNGNDCLRIKINVY